MRHNYICKRVTNGVGGPIWMTTAASGKQKVMKRWVEVCKFNMLVGVEIYLAMRAEQGYRSSPPALFDEEKRRHV